MSLIVIIDGNNLAYYLYDIQGRYDYSYDMKLIEHLINWFDDNPNDILVELCFDRSPFKYDSYEDFRIFTEERGRKADSLIEERADFHWYQSNVFLVVTIDGDLTNSIFQRGGQAISVRDFVTVKDKESPKFISLNKYFIEANDFEDIEEFFLGFDEVTEDQLDELDIDTDDNERT